MNRRPPRQKVKPYCNQNASGNDYARYGIGYIVQIQRDMRKKIGAEAAGAKRMQQRLRMIVKD
jgi:hypothetical protein